MTITANRRILLTALLGVALACVLAAAFRPSLYAPYAEGTDYFRMARGDFSNVYNFYRGRVLHPYAVRLAAQAAHAPIDANVFRAVSAGTLIAFFCFAGVYYGAEYSWAGCVLLFLLANPRLIEAYRNYYWQEMFHTAVCMLFFLLARTRPWLALPVVFLLYLTRESTIVLVGALFLVALSRRDWKLCLGVLAVALAAMKVQGALVAGGLPNHHGIPTAFLDFLRIPYNFAYNICGVEIWTNTLPTVTILPPKWVVQLPSWVHLGNIRQVGYSGFFWANPVQTLVTLATAFGILPLVFIQKVARDWRSALHERFDVAAALVYGGLMFLLTPLVGTVPDRYVIDAWPAFWIFGAGAVSADFPAWGRKTEIVLLSVFVAWIPSLVGLAMGRPPVSGAPTLTRVTPAGAIVSLVIAAACYWAAWRFLNRRPSENISADPSPWPLNSPAR